MADISALALVRQAYDALLGDDTDGFLALLADDAAVRYHAPAQLPYGGEWRGRDEVTRFLDVHDELEEILEFEIDEPVEGGGRVFVVGRFHGRSRVTDRAWSTAFVHVFEVADGRIKRWESFFDTGAAIEAHRR